MFGRYLSPLFEFASSIYSVSEPTHSTECPFCLENTTKTHEKLLGKRSLSLPFWDCLLDVVPKTD